MSSDFISIAAELGKTDLVKEFVDSQFPNVEGISMFGDMGLTAVGIVNSVIQANRMKKSSLIIKQELEKLRLALSVLDEKMKKHQISELKNFVGVNFNTKMYQFIKTIFQEAIDAKSDKLREYCASTIVYLGEAEFSEEINYRKLYRCLNIIQQIDDLDIDLIHYYDVNVQKAKNYGVPWMRDRADSYLDELIANKEYSAQDIYLSSEKLTRIGILDYGINNTKTGDSIGLKTQHLTDFIVLNNPHHPTELYLEFNKYVHTYL